MKIAIFTNNYLPNPFGVSESVETFRKEFEKNGHTVYIFAPGFNGYVDENPQVYRYPAIDLKFKNIRFPIAIPFSFKLNRVLKNLEIDIIHSQHPNLLGWEAKRWAKKKKVPLVFTWHTLYDKYAHFFSLIPEKLGAWWAIRNAVKYADKADQVIVPTLSVKKIIENWGVDNKNIVAIPTGVKEEYFANPDREEAKKEYGIADDETTLLIVSRLTAEKNVEFLTKAVLKVLEENIKVKFILAGAGGELSKLQGILRQAGVEDRVIYPGIVGRDKIKNLYAAGDIFVYASKSETQGMVITEALYAGLPVVAVYATGIKDLVANQVSGLLVKENEYAFAHAVLRLVKDGHLRKTFSENAKKIAREHYTAKACAERMFGVYEEAIAGKK